MRRTAAQRTLFLLLAGTLLWSALVWQRKAEIADTLERARADAGCVVHEDGQVSSGREAWREFYETAQAGRPAAVRLVDWFSADESGPERMYVSELTFDGEVYTISGESGNLRDSGPWEAEYRNLLYFPDVPSPSPSSAFVSATHYVLADDETLTWDDLWNSWFSPRSEGRIRSREVYTDHVWREEPLLKEALM